MKKRILYLKTSWLDNIGNAFIDVGAIKSILQVKDVQNDKISLIPISEYPIFLFARPNSQWIKLVPRPVVSFSKAMLGSYFEKLKRKVIQRYDYGVNENVKNVFDMISAIKADYVVFSGAMLTIGFFNKFEMIFNKLKNRDTKIIFYGCGGDNYSDLEVEHVRRKFEEIKPYALITRDSTAFGYYKDLAKYSFDGIDCAFFVNQLPVKEIEIDLSPYVVLTFDRFDKIDTARELERELSKKYMVVKTSHTPVPEMTLFGVPKRISEPNVLISDSPYDYLILYAHTEETHTDRVHACVATLSFGNPCRLYTETARAELFKRIGAEEVTKKLIYPDIKKIEREQKNQIDFLSTILV